MPGMGKRAIPGDTKVQDSKTPCKARVSPTKRLHTSEKSLAVSVNGGWGHFLGAMIRSSPNDDHNGHDFL